MNTPPPLPTSPSSAKSIKAIGWGLIVIGPALSLSMAAAGYFLFATMAAGHLSGQPSRWHGGPAFTRLTFELFGSVFLFGLVALVAGIYQVRTGRRHPILVALTLLLGGVMACLVYGIITTPQPAL